MVVPIFSYGLDVVGFGYLFDVCFGYQGVRTVADLMANNIKLESRFSAWAY